MNLRGDFSMPLSQNEQRLMFDFHTRRHWADRKAPGMRRFKESVIKKKKFSVVVPDGQRRPPGDPAGRTVVAHGRQCFGGALRQAEQPGCVQQRHLLPGLDTPTDEGENFRLTGKLMNGNVLLNGSYRQNLKVPYYEKCFLTIVSPSCQ